jgi:hypothetical protein
MNDKTGGPAFPRIEPAYGVQGPKIYSGMTLRDYFAAKAIALIMDGDTLDQLPLEEVPRVVASCAFAIADAMLKERDK